jgi:hypothetical protein
MKFALQAIGAAGRLALAAILSPDALMGQRSPASRQP